MTRADAGGSHALTPPGREACSLAATRHGVYAMAASGLLPGCARCPLALRERCPEYRADAPADTCPVLAGYRSALLAALEPEFESAGGHIREHEKPLVAEYVHSLVVVKRIDMLLAVGGMEIPVVREVAAAPSKPGEAYVRKAVGLDAHPLLALRSQYSGRAFAQAEALGLSPAGRHKLGLAVRGEDRARPVTLEEIAAERAGEEASGGA